MSRPYDIFITPLEFYNFYYFTQFKSGIIIYYFISILDKEAGLITMKHGVPEGRYVLHFKVYDRKHTQTDVAANVTVVIKEISHEAVVNSGSFRIHGMIAEEFVKIWDDQDEKVIKSKIELFREKLAIFLPEQVALSNIDVFSVMTHSEFPKSTDVRFSVHGSPFFKPVKLNGVLLRHREEFERELGINITMVGIDECLYENENCEGSCTNSLEISPVPYMVDANKTSLGIISHKLIITIFGHKYYLSKKF